MWSPLIRLVVGILSGVGGSGAMFGISVVGRAMGIETPVDLSGVIMIIPLVATTYLAGVLLRGRLAVGAIALGATATPLAAIVLMRGGCAAAGFAAIGLAFFALVGLVIGGFSALGGSRTTVPGWLARDPRVSLAVLISISLIGLAGFVATMPSFSCN